MPVLNQIFRNRKFFFIIKYHEVCIKANSNFPFAGFLADQFCRVFAQPFYHFVDTAISFFSCRPQNGQGKL